MNTAEEHHSASKPIEHDSDDLLRRTADVYGDRLLIMRGPLKRRTLALKERRRHEVASALLQAGEDHLCRAIQMHQFHPRLRQPQTLSIASGQCRTGEHNALPGTAAHSRMGRFPL